MLTTSNRLAGGDRTAELVGAGGEVRLVLARAGVTYLDVGLGDLLVVSTGRPWQVVRPGIDRDRVRHERDALRMACGVGGLAAELELRFDGELLALDVCWSNRGRHVVRDLALGLAFDLPDTGAAKVTIPGVVYNGNPSADPTREVPKLEGGYVCEEHRLPIPALNVEWSARYLSLFSRPTCREDADGRVRYGSLGAGRSGDTVRLHALSGVVSFNGQSDVTYVHKGATAPTESGYLDLAPDCTFRQSYLLDWGEVEHAGQGFRALVGRSATLFAEPGARPLTLAEIVRYKTAALDARWETRGYLKFPAWGEPARSGRMDKAFLYGWTGQCLRLAWCDGQLGFAAGDESRVERCRRAVDFYVEGSAVAGVPGLRMNEYVLDADRWCGFHRDGQQVVSSRAHGETLCDLADVVALFRRHGRVLPPVWVRALEEGATFVADAVLPAGIPPLGWRLDGTPYSDRICAAGLPAALGLAKTFALTGEERYLRAAEAMAERFHELHAKTFDRPFAWSTLDAGCEDKEGGIYALLCNLELWQLTGRRRYRERAEVAADWLLTFVYVWNPRFDAGSPLRVRGFSAVGWPGVSVQNHHLDVFFPTYELRRLGELTGCARYVEVADTMAHAMGQGICTKVGEWGFDVVGEQGEAFFQTNWQRRGTSNTWNPSWVIAQPLANALRMLDAPRID